MDDATAELSSMGSALESTEVDGEITALAERIKTALNSIKTYFAENIEMPNLDFNEDLIELQFINILDNLAQIAKDAGTFVLNITFKVWNDADGVGIIEEAMTLFYKFSEMLVPIIDTVTDVLTVFYEEAIAPIVEWIGEKLKDAMSFLGEQFDKIGMWFIDNKENLVGFAENMGLVVGFLWDLFSL